MKRPPQILDRTVTAKEVKAWFGKSQKAQLVDAQYTAIAEFLTELTWPSDAAPPADSHWLVKKPTEDSGKLVWDFKTAAKAANLLIECAPAMTRHWDGLRHWPETCGGHDAMKALSAALAKALPYIEEPFGRYDRNIGHKIPKAWHIPAIIIAKFVIHSMTGNGQPRPAISRQSIVARIVTEALIRMGITKGVTQDAVSKHLERWDQKNGLIAR